MSFIEEITPLLPYLTVISFIIGIVVIIYKVENGFKALILIEKKLRRT